MTVTAVISVLGAAAEYALSACPGILIAIGIMDKDDDSAVDKSRTADDINSDIDKGKDKARARLDNIAASGVLTQAKVKCKRCPAEMGVPDKETIDKEKINVLYQSKITGNPVMDG
ncbi:hypothetical protein CDR68_24325 [Salmonella enterica]|nr:hypothetical protein [Salmonella enterica]